MDSFRRLQKTAGIPSRLIGLGAGVLMGGSIGSSLADILHTGPVGIGSEELWKHEIKEHIRNQASARALKKAQEKVRRVGTAGAFAGGILALPFAITKKKPLIGLAGVLLGRQLTRTLAKKKHPLADPKLSAMDLLFSKYRGLLNDEEAATWKQIMTSDYLKKNPEQRNQLIGHFVSKARQNPAYAEYERKKKLGKTLGMIGGAGLMLAGVVPPGGMITFWHAIWQEGAYFGIKARMDYQEQIPETETYVQR